MSGRSWQIAIMVAAFLALTAPFRATAQQAASPGAPTAATPKDAAYILGPEDVVEVEVLGRSDFKVRNRVGADGVIQLPYIGAVTAANKTTVELADDVRRALEAGGYFAKPIMRVEIVSYASRYVTVLGSVVTPGLVPVDRPYRLSEILARVGGVRENGADYVVLRTENGPERRLLVTALATGDSSLDPYVSPGDKIFSPQAEVFYISGQVKAPGSYPLATGMTLRMAIAKGGGLTDAGSQKRVKVTRTGGSVERLELDGKILPGDVIVVGERLF